MAKTGKRTQTKEEQAIKINSTTHIWLSEALQRSPDDCRVESITPEMASILLELNYDNRTINETVVRAYAEAMKEGEFLSGGGTISVSDSNRLIDGQQRLTAIIRSGKTISLKTEFSQPEKLRAVVDTGRTRTAGDILYMAGYKNGTLLAAMLTMISAYDENRITPLNIPRPVPKRNLEELVRSMQPDIITSCHWGRSANALKLGPGGMLGALHFLISRRAVETNRTARAEDFLNKLKSGVGILQEDEPVHHLRQLLQKNASIKISATNRGQKKHNAATLLALGIKAWNSESQHKGIKSLQISNRELFPRVL